MESLVSCLGAGGGEGDQAGQQGEGGGEEVEKLAQQIATLEVEDTCSHVCSKYPETMQFSI